MPEFITKSVPIGSQFQSVASLRNSQNFTYLKLGKWLSLDQVGTSEESFNRLRSRYTSFLNADYVSWVLTSFMRQLAVDVLFSCTYISVVREPESRNSLHLNRDSKGLILCGFVPGLLTNPVSETKINSWIQLVTMQKNYTLLCS